MTKQQLKKRSCILLFLIIAILGIIISNSFYFDGYTSEKMSGGATALAYCSGYIQDGNHFSYTGDEQSYIQLLCKNDYTDQLMFAFGNKPDEDVEFRLFYVNDDGTIREDYVTGIWHKGKYTATVDVSHEHFNSYILSMNTDFDFVDVYYATKNNISGTPRIFAYIVSILIAICVAFFANISYKYELITCRIVDWAKALIKEIKENKNVVWKKCSLYAVGIGIAFLGYYVLVNMGKAKWSDKSILVVSMCGLLFGTYIAFRKYAAKKVELFGALTVLIVGSMYAIVEPPNVGVSWDDEIHYQSASLASHLFDKQVPLADDILYDSYQKVALEKYDYSKTEQQVYSNIYNDTIKAKYYKTAGQKPSINIMIAYIPSIVGLILARGCGMSFSNMMAAGRLFNVLMLTILVYFSMKKIKTGKIIPFMIAMIPTNIYIAGNYSYDTWLTGWAMLGLATFFGEWQRPERKICNKAIWLIFTSMILAVMPKLVYFPLTLICFFMPLKKFANKKQRNKYWIFVTFATLLPFVLIYVQNFMNGVGQGDIRGGEAVNSASQMDFVKAEPIKAMLILVNFLKMYLNPIQEGTQYLINQAYFGMVPISANFILVLLVIGALVSREQKEEKFPWWTKVGVVAVYAVIGFMAAFAMYISFTAVGSEEVAGCQGRYLIPTFFPVLYVLTRFSGKTFVKNIVKEENINLLICSSFSIIAIIGLIVGCLNFY